MRNRSIHYALGTIALFMLAGCDDGKTDEPGTPSEVGTTGAGLLKAQDCGDLLANIQADAIAKVEAMAVEWQQYVEAKGEGGGVSVGRDPGWAEGDGVALDADSEQASTGNAPSNQSGTPAPNAAIDDDGGSTASSDGSSGEAGPSGHSETNQQVSGVDEGDIVKTDGEVLYVLHGTTLQILDAWPAADTAITAEVTIEGSPLEMFVHGGKALIYSSVADPEQNTDESEYTYCDAFGCYREYYYYGGAFTKLTMVDVASSTPAVTGESYVEGGYVSARLHETLSRGVVQGGFKAPTLYYPDIETTDPWGEPYSDAVIEQQLDSWVSRMTSAIQATELEDWLPRQYQRSSGILKKVEPACGDFYTPAPGAVSYGITSIVAADLAAETPTFSSTVVLGEASTVYANAESLILAQPQYSWSVDEGDTEKTAIHLFAIDPSRTEYVASGYAPGTIVDQFSLDEVDGVVRATTTQWDNSAGQQTSRVVTLQGSGEELVVLDQTEALAPGESVMSTRFLGDRAYVVTYLQRDPLFVVDLTDPADLRVLGQLKVDGYSDYIHPLEDGHLLTIGRNTDPDNGMDLGLMLQIFDVTDPTDPTQKYEFTYTTNGWSEANANHKAFTFDADRGLLAFPYVDYNAWPTASSLEVFKVSAKSGFEQLGSIGHGELLDGLCEASAQNQYYSCVYSPEVRRGVFIDDYVYSISYGGVMVHSLDALSTPVATVAFPQPTYVYTYGYAEPGMMVDSTDTSAPTRVDVEPADPGITTGGTSGTSSDPGTGATGATDSTGTESDFAGAGGAAG